MAPGKSLLQQNLATSPYLPLFSPIYLPLPVYTLEGSKSSQLSCHFPINLFFFAKMLYKPKFQPPLWVTHHWILPHIGTMQLINLCFPFVNLSFVNLICKAPANKTKRSREKYNFSPLHIFALDLTPLKFVFVTDMIYPKCIFFKRFIYFYLFLTASVLSCGMQDLRWGTRDLSLRHAGFSLVVACGFSLL